MIIFGKGVSVAQGWQFLTNTEDTRVFTAVSTVRQKQFLTVVSDGFWRRKLKNHLFMLFEALEWHHYIPDYCKWLNSYESLQKNLKDTPYEVKYHSIIVSEIRFCIKTCAATLSMKGVKKSKETEINDLSL